MNRSASVIALWALASHGVFAAEPITEKNWLNHPEIVEVRSLYQAIKESKEAGTFRKKERRFDYCQPYEDTIRTLYTDQDGKPRIYSYEGGSDDSAVQGELFYDENGKLRFAFFTAGAVNGTNLEHRVYFSKVGRKIWEVQKLLKGPGYPFPKEWREAELAQDPMKAYKEKNPCPETR